MSQSLRQQCAGILVRLGDALNAAALRLDPYAPTREYLADLDAQFRYLEEMDWLREHPDPELSFLFD